MFELNELSVGKHFWIGWFAEWQKYSIENQYFISIDAFYVYAINAIESITKLVINFGDKNRNLSISAPTKISFFL